MSPRERFPRRVYRDGDEPDPRFSLANERTFLAWLRTSLALYAAAFALEALTLPSSPTWRAAAAAVFLLLGTVGALQAWWRWSATERSLRHGRPLPGMSAGAVMVLGLVLGAILVTLGLVP